ncbi:MAG: LPS export ABC transporter periplasmic protein LptC [Candidatus Dechloromonas phosphoritropha]|nr:LPS export ABC transporter periplasmic protein LptC [Candidatus Dechloromonas phosphoritropha]MBP8787648.1 LPS export ABC transporter periplasmic protein LptC [Azonexus sp.]MBP9228156.1 LPS export ABC transporter periplasmic protein LptC [Azonexus sp.]
MLVLLALLAGLTFWLQKVMAPAEAVSDGKFRHDPDIFAENFIIRTFDEGGRVKYRLTAPYMEHFPDDDSSELKSPVLTQYRPDAVTLTTSGNNARVTSQGDTVFLWDDVKAVRSETRERPVMVARMPDLTVEPDTGIAFTNSAVEITEDRSWVKGVGMQVDNNASTFVLQSQVTGMSYPRRAKK